MSLTIPFGVWYCSRMSRPIAPEDLFQHFPETIWYLTGDGTNIYCRRPYSFLFSTGAAAKTFAEGFEAEELELTVVGFDREDINVSDLMAAFRAMAVSRVFIDPSIDADTGDVFGTILRLAEAN